ncbi:hypothetical protein A2960_05425 [Candidatus Gottesmanbacteria bacterium RIFCSPLOWO2_01_FULL_39_12b]|uniref:N-(5'-phosphoribosyl)anthranilate isomerase n=1 Tax=Candidatus Gottesmanbacteria bacterium RIFCSPLOWO2_01_FULL_39_12b TaxID=1798388 RepID=A0A1F6AM27_9BACT|nr:MAG: hypothetical protein A2960_05425 [Candidatus Gottesmanbacteria bacterium RIFCSPLOWO2_01_FULL_39_12b]
MKCKVKICGIRTIETAQTAIKFGADFLGFNFVPASDRFVSQLKAKEIIGGLHKEIKVVGVFQNETLEEIKKSISFLKLDFVQLHGQESPHYDVLTQYAGVIKTFSLNADFDITSTLLKMQKYNVDYFLVDRITRGVGYPLDPERVRGLTSHFPIILSGGLTTENVREVVHIARPKVVDVASGVETDGEQDIDKIREFIKRAKYD